MTDLFHIDECKNSIYGAQLVLPAKTLFTLILLRFKSFYAPGLCRASASEIFAILIYVEKVSKCKATALPSLILNTTYPILYTCISVCICINILHLVISFEVFDNS